MKLTGKTGDRAGDIVALFCAFSFEALEDERAVLSIQFARNLRGN
jgi:hypothetical protein